MKTRIHTKAVEQLQAIQNAALRVILHKLFDPLILKNKSNKRIVELGGLPSVATRLDELVDRFVSSAISTKNRSFSSAWPNLTHCRSKRTISCHPHSDSGEGRPSLHDGKLGL